MFDEILTDETKRLKTIIFENGMGVAWLKEANKELLEMNIEEVAQEESKMNTRIAELQAITLPEKEKEDGEERDLKKLNDEQTKELRELTEKTGTLKGKLDAWYGVTNQMKQLYARIKEASWNLDNINYDLTDIVKEGKEFKNEK